MQKATQSRDGQREDFARYCPMCGRDAVPEIRRGEQGFCSEDHAQAYLVEVPGRAPRGEGD